MAAHSEPQTQQCNTTLFQTEEIGVYFKDDGRNTRGRDFVAGDIHGNKKALEKGLFYWDFSPDRGDRLFAVGDLVDWGEDSFAILELLDYEWFLPVLGNHDLNFIISTGVFFGDSRPAHYCPTEFLKSHGGGWFFEASAQFPSEVLVRANQVAALPSCRTAGLDFHVVHANLVSPEIAVIPPYVLKDLHVKAIVNKNITLPDIYYLLEDRELARKAEKNKMPFWNDGTAPTFCGHTALDAPKVAFSHVFLETRHSFECVTIANIGEGLTGEFTSDGKPIIRKIRGWNERPRVYT